MISKERFCKLKAGDIVLFNGSPRTVRELHICETSWGKRASITFAIKRRSWTNRIYTVYGYNDVKHALSLPRKKRNRREICQAEQDLLSASGFDVRREVAREARELEELERRTGREYADKRAKRLLDRTMKKLGLTDQGPAGKVSDSLT